MTRGFEVFRATLERFATRPEIRQIHGGQRIHDVVVRAGTRCGWPYGAALGWA
ncbi:hypothetical protein I540_5320 [Mycobacteroides abscessus subsp. bolletii 1513]|uniref:Uncharacterized protein n=1 Tax=Mycobacteroides abscessus subsp. bolletii 1513 TaxID=1299321 RepID=X8DFU5_9MYCO|nr:hypothetical protein I540_5320 [Mycobacteroides abscessus subsp. bolletii 1513]